MKMQYMKKNICRLVYFPQIVKVSIVKAAQNYGHESQMWAEKAQ